MMLPTCKTFYKVLSNQSDIYKDNDLYNFRFALLEEISFTHNQWEVALCDIQLTKPAKSAFDASIWVCCNIVAETQVGAKKEQLLRRINTSGIKGTTFYASFTDKIYLPITCLSIREIHITIKGLKHAKTAEALPQGRQQVPTTLTLHFRQREK